MAKVITFSSFKGGSGRSTTCLNFAAQLSQRGNRVLLVDLDIDGPGMGTLLSVSDEDISRRGWASFAAGEQGSLRRNVIPYSSSDARLDFLGVPVEFTENEKIPDDVVSIEEAVSRLKSEAKPDYDFVVVDGASGMSSHSVASLAISDVIALCFKWSRQHFRGMMSMLDIMCAMLESNRFSLQDFVLIANAVPRPVTRVEERTVADAMNAIQSILQNRFSSETTPKGLQLPKTQKVWEIPSMKFFEHIAEADTSEADDFNALTNYIVSRCSSIND